MDKLFWKKSCETQLGVFTVGTFIQPNQTKAMGNFLLERTLWCDIEFLKNSRLVMGNTEGIFIQPNWTETAKTNQTCCYRGNTDPIKPNQFMAPKPNQFDPNQPGRWANFYGQNHVSQYCVDSTKQFNQTKPNQNKPWSSAPIKCNSCNALALRKVSMFSVGKANCSNLSDQNAISDMELRFGQAKHWVWPECHLWELC